MNENSPMITHSFNSNSVMTFAIGIGAVAGLTYLTIKVIDYSKTKKEERMIEEIEENRKRMILRTYISEFKLQHDIHKELVSATLENSFIEDSATRSLAYDILEPLYKKLKNSLCETSSVDTIEENYAEFRKYYDIFTSNDLTAVNAIILSENSKKMEREKEKEERAKQNAIHEAQVFEMKKLEMERAKNRDDHEFYLKVLEKKGDIENDKLKLIAKGAESIFTSAAQKEENNGTD